MNITYFFIYAIFFTWPLWRPTFKDFLIVKTEVKKVAVKPKTSDETQKESANVDAEDDTDLKKDNPENVSVNTENIDSEDKKEV